MMHLSRFCEELILWMSPRFGFIDLADRFCTGSSIMPQKKNPDVPELIRGKTGRVNGHLVALLTLMKGQPLAYNKDNQEDKEPLFDTVDTVTTSLAVFTEMLGGIEVKREAMREAARAGLCDRDRPRRLPGQERACLSAKRTKRSRRRCATPKARGKDLSEIALAELQQFSPLIEQGRLRRAHARRLDGGAQPHRRHGAEDG